MPNENSNSANPNGNSDDSASHDDSIQSAQSDDLGALLEYAQKIEALTQKNAELETNWKRAAADLLNFRKQAEVERASSMKFANEKILNALLPILDNFERAAAHTPAELKDNEWAKGIAAIEAQLATVLTSFGLEKIAAGIGDAVDPNQHELIATGPGAINTITEIFEAGYKLGNKILRATKVRVGNGTKI